MNKEILESLQQIEAEQNVKILLACESGSRAWGFPSADSDFDVRFIYLRPTAWYLTIDVEKKRDVIERPINNQLDVNGWDLRKALQLFRKSNPPLLEWLGSPIIYWEQFSIAQQMRELAPLCYSPLACMYHYWHMAEGNVREYLKGETVWVKKYFYVLRPLLAMRWLEQERGVVPTEFHKLVDGLVQDQTLAAAIHQLIEEKRQGRELAYGPRIPAIADFIDQEVAHWQQHHFAAGVQKCPTSRLNQLFQAALAEVWEGK
jgi:predicted nucleotidyltransferase